MIVYAVTYNHADDMVELIAYESNDLWNGTTQNTSQYLTYAKMCQPHYSVVYESICFADAEGFIYNVLDKPVYTWNAGLAFVKGYNKVPVKMNTKLNTIYNEVKQGINKKCPILTWGTMAEFRNYPRTKPVQVEKFMLNIQSVEKHSDGYTFHYKNGGGVQIWKNGASQKIDINGKRYRKNFDRCESTGKGDSCHYRIQYNSETIYIEKLVILAECFLNDNIPMDLRGLNANVMDLTGNPNTADKLGLQVNLTPDNIEFCWGKDNLAHPNTVLALLRMFGHVYKVSAIDHCLNGLISGGRKEEIAWYINLVKLPVVK